MKISNETKVGILAAFALTLLVIGYNFLKGKDLFTSSNEFVAIYKNVNGIKVSNPVLYNGLAIGRVSDLELDSSGKIVAVFSINEDVNIPDNSIAKITSTDLLGSKAVELIIGDSKTYLEDGDTISSGIELSLAESVNSQVLPVKAKAEKLLSTMDSILISVQYILNPNFRSNIDKSFASIKRSIETLEVTTTRVDTFVKYQSARFKVISANVESITTNLKNNNQKITDILTNLDQITDSLAKSNILQTINNANKAIADVAVITQKINRGEGSMGLLINDKKLYENLNNSASDLDKLLLDIKQNPKRYISFSVFGGSKKADKKAAKKK
jgi:phospholipid/cholesterol/gamma-HCH transport system substrate-binding protein